MSLKWVTRLVEDSDGQPSTMRVLALIVVLDVIVVWNLTVIRDGWQDPGWPTAAIVAAALGPKAVQALAEARRRLG